MEVDTTPDGTTPQIATADQPIDYFNTCPIDICEMILRRVEGISRSGFARLLCTCKRLRDCAYVRILPDIFDNSALVHTCQCGNTKYYARAVSKLVPGHLKTAVKWCQFGICKYIISMCAASCNCGRECGSSKYLREEKITPREILQNRNIMNLLINFTPMYLCLVWNYIINARAHNYRPTYEQVCDIFASQHSQIADLGGATPEIFGLTLGVDNALAVKMLSAGVDLSSKLASLNRLTTVILAIAPCICEYPWDDPCASPAGALDLWKEPSDGSHVLVDTTDAAASAPRTDLHTDLHTDSIREETNPLVGTYDPPTDNKSVIALLHYVLDPRKYQKSWIISNLRFNSSIPASYIIYLGLVYGLRNFSLPHGPISERALRYYLKNTAPQGVHVVPDSVHKNIIIAVNSNPQMTDYMFDYIPVERFTVSQLYDLLTRAKSHEYFNNIFDRPYVNPPWFLTDSDIEDAILRYVSGSSVTANAPSDASKHVNTLDLNNLDLNTLDPNTLDPNTLDPNTNITDNDIAAAIESATASASSYRMLVLEFSRCLMTGSHTKLLELLLQWKKLRTAEEWKPEVAVGNTIRARIHAEELAAEIDREQERIRRGANHVEVQSDDGFSDAAAECEESDDNTADESLDYSSGSEC